MHWVRPGIEPTSSWILALFINCWATMGTPESLSYWQDKGFSLLDLPWVLKSSGKQLRIKEIRECRNKGRAIWVLLWGSWLRICLCHCRGLGRAVAWVQSWSKNFHMPLAWSKKKKKSWCWHSTSSGTDSWNWNLQDHASCLETNVWSSSGGPFIPAELSEQQQLAWRLRLPVQSWGGLQESRTNSLPPSFYPGKSRCC